MNNKEINKLSQPQGYRMQFNSEGLIISQTINGKSDRVVIKPSDCSSLLADIKKAINHGE